MALSHLLCLQLTYNLARHAKKMGTWKRKEEEDKARRVHEVAQSMAKLGRTSEYRTGQSVSSLTLRWPRPGRSRHKEKQARRWQQKP